jgi:hypothetical protein
MIRPGLSFSLRLHLGRASSDPSLSDKYLIGAEIIAFVKWLIYTAPFKDRDCNLNAEPRVKIHSKVYKDSEWRGTVHDAEKKMRRKLKAQLAIWYAKHPPSKRRAHLQGRLTGTGIMMPVVYTTFGWYIQYNHWYIPYGIYHIVCIIIYTMVYIPLHISCKSGIY